MKSDRLLQRLVFSRLFSSENCPTIAVASLFFRFFCQKALTLLVPLFVHLVLDFERIQGL